MSSSAVIPESVKIKNGALPDTPGVYLMKNAAQDIMYVGKAANLARRVTSYFARPHDERIQKMVSNIATIDYIQVDTAIEALILEADLIKKLEPPFNVKEKDGKSFLYVEITKDEFPRVLLVRGKDQSEGRRFGPFTSASSAREALRIVRRIFPFSTHVHMKQSIRTISSHNKEKINRPCFDYQIGLCPGTCAGLIDKREYKKTINHITLFFEGKKQQIIRSLEREMESASKKLDFERAEYVRRKLFALRHIQDVALINDTEFQIPGTERVSFRIEGYDISNISGVHAVGSMVVFVNGVPDKQEYRKFRIKGVEGANDTGMLTEILTRRLQNPWPLPKLFLIDGGKGQVNAARKVLRNFKVAIPVIGLAKGPERKRNDIVGIVPSGVQLETLIRVRDEAHRFAIGYHKRLRAARFLVS